MSVRPKLRMTVDEFLAWIEGREGRYELVDGAVVAMSPQTARHVRTKSRIHAALERSIAAAGLACEAMADGMTVQIDSETAFEPDALVQCGERIADDALVATDPILLVEVLSPGTRRIDTGRKLEGYFRVPSVMHYLVIDSERPMVIHHRRADGGMIETRIASAGVLRIEPPGLTIGITDLFEPAAP